MEENEQKRIVGNLHRLVRDTVCGPQFYAYLITVGILNQDEVDMIDCKSTPGDKARHFYRIIQTKLDGYRCLIEALEATNQTGVLAILDTTAANKVKRLLEAGQSNQQDEEKSKRARQSKTGIRFDVKPPAQLFTGRLDELDELHRKIKSDQRIERVTVITQLTSISGLGGIGKTELARQYILDHGHEFDGNVIWINAERHDTLAESFRRLAKDKLGISTKDANGGEKDIATIVGDVYEAFENSKVLFVFDNAERSDYLKTFLEIPRGKERLSGDPPCILITSRDSEWKLEYGAELVKLNEMKPDEAIEFVRKGLSIQVMTDDTKNLILSLVNRLQCFPLALQQAISYIKEQSLMDDYSVQNYLDEFETNQQELLDSDAFHGIFNDYQKTTFTTWKMTLAKISNEPKFGNSAVKILNCMAYISAEDIHREMFLPLIPNRNEKELKMAVRLLVKYSMVNGDQKQVVLSIHRLVQQVIRIDLQSGEQEEVTLGEILGLVQPTTIYDFETPMTYLGHALFAWPHVHRYSSLVKQYNLMPCYIANGLKVKETFREAYSFGMQELERKTLEMNLTPGHESVLGLEYHMGMVMFCQGKYDEALERLTGLLDKMQKNIGEMHVFTLHTKHCMANIYYIKRELDQALELYLDGYEKKKLVLGVKNSKTVDSIFNAGLCSYNRGKYDKALECYEKALEHYTEIYEGKENEESAVVLNNMALVKRCVGDLDGSVEILRDLYTRKNEIGLSKMWMTEIGYTLGFHLSLQEKFQEAWDLCEEVLKERVALFGKEHFYIYVLLYNMGYILRHLGKYEAARELLQSAYDSYTKLFGVESAHTKQVKVELAFVLAYLGHLDEAISDLELDVKLLEKEMGKTTFDFLRVYLDLASVYEMAEEYEKALIILEDVYKTFTDSFGSKHFMLNRIDRAMERIKAKYVRQ